MPQLDALKEELLRTDPEFRRLFDEHQTSKKQLEELHRKSLLTQEDEVLEKQLKLHKLALKDRMELIARSHRESGVPV